jgi:hypothetical protein
MMSLSPGDKVSLRKAHPCGSYEWIIKRAGMDFRIQCKQCGHQAWISRTKLERSIKSVIINETTRRTQ